MGERLLGDANICEATCREYLQIHTALTAERDPVKRTALTDGMVEVVANTWLAVPIIEGMGYYVINTRRVGEFAPIRGRHELGDVFERMPRPEQKPWKK